MLPGTVCTAFNAMGLRERIAITTSQMIKRMNEQMTNYPKNERTNTMLRLQAQRAGEVAVSARRSVTTRSTLARTHEQTDRRL